MIDPFLFADVWLPDEGWKTAAVTREHAIELEHQRN
jgi:hypothetical protein